MPAPRVLEPVPELAFGDDDNRVIEGDNLQVMVALRSQYQGAIDFAYLDPPYNTGKDDFPYSDRRFHDPNADADDMVYVSNEDGGRHTKWLNFMGPRLWLTWQLLAEHGICFVSINDVELFRLGLLMDEIFGERNRLGIIIWKQGTDNNPTRIAVEHEYILCYAKRIEDVPPVWQGPSAAKEWMLQTFADLKVRHSNLGELETVFKAAIREHEAAYKAALKTGEVTDIVNLGALARYNRVDSRGPYAAIRNTDNPGRMGYTYSVIHPVTGKPVKKPASGYRFPEEKMRQLVADDFIIFGRDENKLLELKKYLKDVREPLRSVIDLDGRAAANLLKKLLPGAPDDRFKTAKPVELMVQLLAFAGDEDALILDPFAGSGTTGHAALRLNARDGGHRRFIMIEEGTHEDRYCRSVILPRLRAAIEQENLPGGFQFETVGRRLDRNAIVELERGAITNLIMQTDITGKGSGLRKIEGEQYVIAQNSRLEAICLCWQGRHKSAITRDVLTAMFDEAKRLGLRRPLRVYGSTCEVGETESFRFCQIPDEILAALQLEEAAETPEDDVTVIERLEAAAKLAPVNAG